VPADERHRPWLVPAAVGSSSIAGLVLALLADGVWNAVACALAAAPLVALTKGILTNRRGGLRKAGTPEGNR
jgi:uncharacterized membrane protein YjjP (DUF1212 family)